MKNIVIILLVLCYLSFAENYLLNGGQKSRINYTLIEQITPVPGTVTVSLTIVEPVSFQSPTYNQQIDNFKIQFSVQPDKQEKKSDRHGNKIVKYSWQNPGRTFQADISFNASNNVSFNKVETNTPFPMQNLSSDINHYLKSTKQVQSDHSQVKNLALELTQDAKTEYEVVQNILSYLIDNTTYVLTPEKYDAIWTLKSGKGNCQNYSHLAAALMRAAGIPVRIVNGITLKEPYNINVGGRILTMNMAEGRHSWIEVYFPDLGWMPVDPQQTELFVSNRFIRIETGLDNEETMNDGLVGWTRQKGSNAIVSFRENIKASFISDKVDIKATPMSFGPKKLLLAPEVGIEIKPVAIASTEPEKPQQWSYEQIQKIKFSQTFVFGNLEFPENVNFAFTRDVKEGQDSESQLQKNFLVETAEYVTSTKDFTQVFVLDQPVQLHQIALALQNFGGSGDIWLELYEDAKGSPAKSAMKSAPINLRTLSIKPGYRWIEFDFQKEQMVLTPGRYWIKLGYSGSPIINWFYSYGKPVGPIDGTRYKLPYETHWTRNLGFEFNYRVTGLTGE